MYQIIQMCLTACDLLLCFHFQELLDFLIAFAKKVSRTRKKFGLDKKSKLSPVEKQIERLTLSQLVEFVDKCKEKYMKGKFKTSSMQLKFSPQNQNTFIS